MANNVFQVKRTSVAGRTPNTTSFYATNSQYIAAGELALNMTDQILYTSDGTNLISVGANIANQRITNSLTLNNNVKINWRDVYGANISFVHQSDDNSVFYSTNVAHQPRAIWSVFANSDTSAFIVSAPAQFNSNATYNGTNIILSGSAGILANGSLGSNGWVLTSNGTSAYWISPGASSTDVTANFAWQNTHTFQKQTIFTGNGISLVTNTGGINFNGTSDSNWRIGRNTGLTTKFYYSNNTFDIIAAASNLEGFVIGQPGGNTYLETGYAGTFTKNPIYVGNATVNVSINSTSFTGTANNATNLGGVAAASYVNTSGNYTVSGNINFTGTNVYHTSTLYAAGQVVIGAAGDLILANGSGIQANGTWGAAGYALMTDGSGNDYWGNPATNTSAQYTWSNTQTFSNTITFSSSLLGSTINATSYTTGNVTIGTGGAVLNTSVLFIGNNTVNATFTTSSLTLGTYWVTNSTGAYTTGLVNAASYNIGTTLIANTTGVYHTGVVNAASYNTGGGYGTVTGGSVVNSSVIAVGNSTVNTIINATSFSGVANNASNLGGVPASNYVNTSGAYTISGVHTHTANIYANSALFFANAIAHSVTTGATANGTTQATAYPIVTTSVQFTTVAAGSGAILPTAVPGQRLFIANDGANQLLLYPAVGGLIDQAAVNAAVTIAAGGMWEGQSLTTVNWTSISPDTQGANGVVVTQGNGAVMLTVNAAYINTISANNAAYLGGTAAASYQLNSTLNANVASYLPLYNGVVNASSVTMGNVSVGFTGNTAGLYHTGIVNAATFTTTGAANVGTLNVTGNASISGNMTVSGNLTLSGNTLIVGANNLIVQDAVMSIHTLANLAPWTTNDLKQVGIALHYYDTADKQGLLSITQSNGVLTYYSTSTDAAIADPVGNTLGTFQAGVLLAGNSTVYTTVNATNYSGTSNNALYLGGTAAASYALKADVHYIGTTSVALNRASAALSLTGVSIDGTANNSTYFNSQPATYYTNATNITTGVLPWAQAPTNTVNTSGAFTITGVHTHSANVSVTGTSKFTGVVDAASANTLNQTLTDGATITWDTSLGQIGTVTLAGNRTMAAPTNLKVTTYILHVLQDATGSRTITWNSVFKWTAGAAPVLSTGAGKRDVFSFISDGTNLYGSYLPDVR